MDYFYQLQKQLINARSPIEERDIRVKIEAVTKRKVRRLESIAQVREAIKNCIKILEFYQIPPTDDYRRGIYDKVKKILDDVESDLRLGKNLTWYYCHKDEKFEQLCRDLEEYTNCFIYPRKKMKVDCHAPSDRVLS